MIFSAFRRVFLLLFLLALPVGAQSLPTTIMPLGDSITEGLCSRDTNGACVNPYTGDPNRPGTNAYTLAHYRNDATFCGSFAQRMAQNYNPDVTGGYRAPLIRLLRGAGVSASYVGHLHSGTELDPVDRSHEGHGGWQAEHIDYCAPQYVALTLPNVVLLYIGANDLVGDDDVVDTAAHIQSIQDAIASYAPATRLVIGLNAVRFDYSSGTPVVDEAYELRRKALVALVAAQSGYDSPCQARNLADMAVMPPAEFTPQQGSGGLHPNEQGYARMGSIWFHALMAPPCRLETRTFVSLGGLMVESITGYGRYWNFALDGTPLGNGPLNTRDIPRFIPICQGQDVCAFDTRTFIGDGDNQVESITANGQIWDFGLDGTLRDTAALKDIPRYRNGPCALAPQGTDCVFDTRTVAAETAQGPAVETITAYGHRFDFAPATGLLLGDAVLTASPRYAPVCAARPDFHAPCRLETRSVVVLPGIAPVLESITAYGRYWTLDAGSGALLDAGNLADVPHLAHAPTAVDGP